MTASLKAASLKVLVYDICRDLSFKFLRWGKSQHILFSVVTRKVMQEIVEDVIV
jgi:hypothetical protein